MTIETNVFTGRISWPSRTLEYVTVVGCSKVYKIKYIVWGILGLRAYLEPKDGGRIRVEDFIRLRPYVHP